MKFQDLREKNIVIWGAGRDGLSVLRWLRGLFPVKMVTIYTDQDVSEALVTATTNTGPVRFTSHSRYIESLTATDVVIKSPGVSLYRKDIDAAKKRGVRFLSATNLWFSQMQDKTVIAVTGTKGKSTTASILYHCLDKHGVSVELVGNIGKPLLDHFDKRTTDIFVVELSSYQTADICYTPQVSILVNLYPEHIDWHKTTENYYRDKLNLFRPDVSRHTILNAKDEMSRKLTSGWNCIRYFEGEDVIHSKGIEVYYGSTCLGSVKNAYLQGRHNLSNICAALTGLEALGFDPKTQLGYLDDFVGLPHRQEMLGIREGVLYVDDSISTTPESAMAAIDRFSDSPTTILLGGFDREQRYEELVHTLFSKKIRLVVTMPANGDRIAALVEKEKKLRNSGPDLVRAVDLFSAVDIARKNTPSGGVVLLSPAAPSYGVFTNFEERGRLFRVAAGF